MRLRRGVEADARMPPHGIGPVALQLPQAGRFPPQAYLLHVINGSIDSQVGMDRVGPGMVQPGDIIRLCLVLGQQGPDLGNMLLLRIQDAGAKGGAEPFVEARAVIIAIEFSQVHFDLAHAMGSVYQNFHPVPVRHVAYFAYRQNLSGNVDHMADHEQARSGCDLLLIEGDELLIRFRVVRYRHLFAYHPVPFGDQFEMVLHGAVILLGVDGLVPCLPGVAPDNGIERFRRVPCNDQSVCRAAKQPGQACRDAVFVLPLHRAHVIRPFVIDHADFFEEGLEGGPGDDIVIAVFQVDVVRLQVVVSPDARPEIGLGCRGERRWEGGSL